MTAMSASIQFNIMRRIGRWRPFVGGEDFCRSQFGLDVLEDLVCVESDLDFETTVQTDFCDIVRFSQTVQSSSQRSGLEGHSGVVQSAIFVGRYVSGFDWSGMNRITSLVRERVISYGWKLASANGTQTNQIAGLSKSSNSTSRPTYVLDDPISSFYINIYKSFLSFIRELRRVRQFTVFLSAGRSLDAPYAASWPVQPSSSK